MYYVKEYNNKLRKIINIDEHIKNKSFYFWYKRFEPHVTTNYSNEEIDKGI